MASNTQSPVGISALNPAHPTVTEADAASIVARTATPAEQAETTAEQEAEQAELEAAADLSDYAANVSARALIVSERATFNAYLAASLAMVIANAPRTVAGREASPDMDEFALNTILSKAVQRGVMVFRNASDTDRDSEVEVAAIVATADPAARAKRAAAYLKTFGTGRKMCEGPANLKTNADRLARFFRAEEAGRAVIGDMFSHRDNHVAAMPAWREAVSAATGCASKGALAEFLKAQYGRAPSKAKAAKAKAAAVVAANPPAPAPVPATLPAPVEPEVRTFTRIVAPDYAAMTEADRIAAILEIASGLTDDGFASLYQRVAAERDARQEARAAAEFERMRVEAETAADAANAKAEAVVAVEAALSTKPVRAIIGLPVREAVAA